MSDSRALTSLLMSLVVAFMAGCGAETGMRNTITINEAETRVEQYFRDALAVLPEQARAEVSLIHTVDCDDPDDNGPKGRKIASVSYQIQNLQPQKYPDYVADLERWWLDHDFQVLDDERPTYESIWVENTGDGFRMRIEANKVGELYLGATSPCVWPDGTPEA
jgi:hypothetical protein